MLNLRNTLLAWATAFVLNGFAHAQPATGGTAPAVGGQGSSASAELVDGEIRKVDKDNRKLTIKHGPIKNLDMPGMTMVFAVKDEAVLDKLQPGEKVRFQAEKSDGKFVVTRIESAK